MFKILNVVALVTDWDKMYDERAGMKVSKEKTPPVECFLIKYSFVGRICSISTHASKHWPGKVLVETSDFDWLTWGPPR